MFIKRQTSDTSSNNEWQRVVLQVTTNCTASDNEWYNEWQQVATNENEWQRVVIPVNFPFFRIKEKPSRELFKSWGETWRGTSELRAEASP